MNAVTATNRQRTIKNAPISASEVVKALAAISSDKHGNNSRCMVVSPVSVVEQLPEQLDRRLGAVDLPHRHVQVVDEYDAALPGRRREQTALALVQPRHDQVLLAGTGSAVVT